MSKQIEGCDEAENCKCCAGKDTCYEYQELIRQELEDKLYWGD